jgi:Cu+-exporting ATPase
MTSSYQETTLDVAGMGCASCVHHVDQALKALAGVNRVAVKLAEGKVCVQHDAAIASSESLLEALAEAGYEATAAR